jgi:hypothetical protein
MLRKVVSAVFVLVVCVGVTLADEIRVFITKVDGDKITFAENKGNGERGESKTLPVEAKVKVFKAKYNKVTKKTTALEEEVKGGLKNKLFAEIGAQGVPATLLTDQDNKKVIEILVTDGGKGNKDK